MLTFDESKIFYGFGNFSSITTAFNYGGCNPAWILSKAPTSTHSELSVKLPIPLVKSTKPTSMGVTYMHPSNLDDEMIIDDRPVPSLLTKNGTCNPTKLDIIFQKYRWMSRIWSMMIMRMMMQNMTS